MTVVHPRATNASKPKQGMSDYYNSRDDYPRGGYEKRQDPPLHTEKITTDRKIYFLDLKENDRGKFVKITEDVRGRRDTILVPIEALDEFIDALQNIRDAAGGGA